ncbi:MAG: acyltransferase domain-containing protein, partial [Acidobacteriota bacterium]
FPGQGGQWAGMGRRLLAREPVFRQAIERCDEAMRPHVAWSLLAEMEGREGTDPPTDIDVVQPLLFALEVGLAALWRSWGIEPDAVIGHSMGEVAAAHVAGALSLDDAARIICRRSRLLRRVRGQGAMAAVELSFENAERALEGYEDRLAIAVHGGPRSTVLSGDPAALDEVLATLEARDIFCRRIRVDVASHSPQVDPLEDDLLAELEGLTPRPGSVPIYSTVDAEIVDGSGFDRSYWVRNLGSSVRFFQMLEHLADDHHTVFIEIGPHPILLPTIREACDHLGHSATVLASLRRDDDERASLLRSLAELYCLDLPIAWERLFETGARQVPLPAYPWQRQRYWLPDPPPQAVTRQAVTRQPVTRPAAAADEAQSHPMLGSFLTLADAPGTRLWQFELDSERFPFLADHQVEGSLVVPGTLSVELALAAAETVLDVEPFRLSKLRYLAPLFLDPDGPQTVQLILRPEADHGFVFTLHARSADDEDEAWTLHSQGRIEFRSDVEHREAADIGPHPNRARQTAEDFYLQASERGNQWGPAFRGIDELEIGTGPEAGLVVANVRPVPEIAEQLTAYCFHPALLDACGQALIAAATEPVPAGAFVLAQLDGVEVYRQPRGYLTSQIVLRPAEPGRLTGDVTVLGDDGYPVARLEGLSIDFLEHGGRSALALRRCFYYCDWQRLTPRFHPSGPRLWLLFADTLGIAQALGERLRSAGEPVEIWPAETRQAQEPSVDELARRLQDLFDTQPGGDWIVVDLRALDTPDPDDLRRAADVETSAVDLLGNVTDLIQALERCADGSVMLWLATQGAQVVDPEADAISPIQACLWGLGRVALAEHPDLLAGLIDLDPQSAVDDEPSVDIDLLSQTLRGAFGQENQIVLRDGSPLGARLSPMPATQGAGRQLELSPHASYLITGGLGDLGLGAAERLVERGARHLVLVGRRALLSHDPHDASQVEDDDTTRRVEAIHQLEARGATVLVAALDVGNAHALEAFLDDLEVRGTPPLRGVVHAAGVQHPTAILDLDRETLAKELRAKVTGSWLLHRALDVGVSGELFGSTRASLDFLVFYSSAATLLPSPLIGGYAAANSFMGALAHDRRQQDLPALAVDWGFWDEVGMAVRYGDERGRRAKPHGVESFSPRQGIDALERLMLGDASRVAVMPIDWQAWRTAYPAAAKAPFFARLLEELPAAEPRPNEGPAEESPEARGPSRDEIVSAAADQRLSLLRSYVLNQVAQVLKVSPTQISFDRSLTQLGLDSLMAIELRKRIDADLDVLVPIVRFLEKAPAGRIIDLLAESIEADAAEEAESEGEGEDEEWETLTL